MSLSTYIERMKYVDDLIRRKATGNLTSLARKLGLSRCQTLRFIKEMKEAGFPIGYSRSSCSYYYKTEGKLVAKLFDQEISYDEMRAIKGGKAIFNFFQSRII